MSYERLLKDFAEHVGDHGKEINFHIETELKYAGYIQRQKNEVAKWDKIEDVAIPKGFDFSAVKGLSNEAREKLIRFHPINLGQASRLSGVSAADIFVLRVALRK